MESADNILREFVADVMAAHGNNFKAAMAILEREWPDLAVTFSKAFKFVERLD